MFSNACSIVSQAMFPIFKFSQGAANQITLDISTTGFFTSSEGHFVTVAHVSDGLAANEKLVYLGLLPDSVSSAPIDITEIARDDTADILVGKIDLKNTKYLSLSKKPASVGKTICIAGYPLPVIALNAQGGFDFSGMRRYYQPSFVLDSIKMNLTKPKPRTHDGYLIRDVGLYGMSGGPVFDTNGTVIGMQSSVTDPRESVNGAQKILVQNAVAIKSLLILELMKAKGIQVGK